MRKNISWRLGCEPLHGIRPPLLCGIAATLAQLAFSTGSNVPNLGASGAIAGVLGSYILLFPRGRFCCAQLEANRKPFERSKRQRKLGLKRTPRLLENVDHLRVLLTLA